MANLSTRRGREAEFDRLLDNGSPGAAEEIITKAGKLEAAGMRTALHHHRAKVAGLGKLGQFAPRVMGLEGVLARLSRAVARNDNFEAWEAAEELETLAEKLATAIVTEVLDKYDEKEG